MKAKKATIIKNGKEITLINPEQDVDIEYLISKFGKLTLKLNHISGPLFEVHGLFGVDRAISGKEDISNLDWEDIEF